MWLLIISSGFEEEFTPTPSNTSLGKEKDLSFDTVSSASFPNSGWMIMKSPKTDDTVRSGGKLLFDGSQKSALQDDVFAL